MRRAHAGRVVLFCRAPPKYVGMSRKGRGERENLSDCGITFPLLFECSVVRTADTEYQRTSYVRSDSYHTISVFIYII